MTNFSTNIQGFKLPKKLNSTKVMNFLVAFILITYLSTHFIHKTKTENEFSRLAEASLIIIY